MEKNITNDDLIERFLDGSLTELEKESFENQLSTDKSLADALAQRKLLQQTYVMASNRIELKKKITKAISDEKRKYANRRVVWLAAASIALLAGIGSIFLFNPKDPSVNSPVAKQDSQLEEDIVVTPNENKMTEFATSDTLNHQPEISNKYQPDDGCVFNQKDTLVFSRPNADLADKLVITDNGGLIVFTSTIQKGQPEQKVMPYTLKPGVYRWKLTQTAVSRKFTIQ